MHSIAFHEVEKVFRRGGFFFPGLRRVETRAVRSLSLEVFPCEVMALLGPNGSGKTTALKLVSTMLLPDRGYVLVNGADTRAESGLVRAQVGFAVANERSFFPRLTVRENLEFFAALENVQRSDRKARVESVISGLDLEAAADKQSMKLSSGMYQRLGIARALLKRPSILLLDEPSRSLDPAAASDLWGLVRTISSNAVTVVLATHNFAEAIAVADHVAILQHGRLLGVRHVPSLTVEQLRSYYLRLTGERDSRPLLEEVPA
jgi:ABC-2 type transport system ATP-binding protein